MVREIVRQHLRFFVLAVLAGLALRLLFVFRFSALTADTFVYGDIAKNWLQHGIYGLSGSNGITPTYIRLPGYPAFLAAVFAVFGMEHYRAAVMLQVLVDLATCFLTADIARRVLSARAAKTAFLLSALCPFLADYAAAALTETWEIFFTVLALDLALLGLGRDRDSGTRVWIGCGLAVGAAILLRPDGGLLLVSLEFFLLSVIIRRRMRSGHTPSTEPRVRGLLKAGLIVAVAALAPLVPWTMRNLRTLHAFEPLAPRYANAPGAFVPMGFERWVKTWMADYVSTEEIYWVVSTGPIDVDNLPSRAFDSPEQLEQTTQLLSDYNQSLRLTPELDARFGALAAERIHHAPLRYYVRLPLVRIADMWLRPRTEILPCNTRWWEFDEMPQWLALSIALGIINLLYIGAGLLGLMLGRFAPGSGLLLTFLVLRSLFLGSLENPEPRYTLECYPVLIVMAAALFSRLPDSNHS